MVLRYIRHHGIFVSICMHRHVILCSQFWIANIYSKSWDDLSNELSNDLSNDLASYCSFLSRIPTTTTLTMLFSLTNCTQVRMVVANVTDQARYGGYAFTFIKPCSIWTTSLQYRQKKKRRVFHDPHLTGCCRQHVCELCLNHWFRKQKKKDATLSPWKLHAQQITETQSWHCAVCRFGELHDHCCP